MKGQITQEAALNKSMEPLRDFMFKQTQENELALFVKISKIPNKSIAETHFLKKHTFFF